MRIPVAHGTLEQHPIVTLADVLSTGDLHPSLATVIDGESDFEFEVFAWYKRWYRYPRRVVQVLPMFEAEGCIDILRSAR